MRRVQLLYITSRHKNAPQALAVSSGGALVSKDNDKDMRNSPKDKSLLEKLCDMSVD
jgi:hypothetical protein